MTTLQRLLFICLTTLMLMVEHAIFTTGPLTTEEIIRMNEGE
jgi:hypothetical protein